MVRAAPLSQPDGALLLRGGLVLDDGEFHAADLLIVAGRFAAVGAVEPPAGARVIDLGGDLVIPGLVDAHYHSPDNLSTGRMPAAPLELWSLASVPSRSATAEELRLSALFGAGQLLLGGVTGVVDMLRFPAAVAAAPFDAVAEAYLDAGIRAAIAPVLTDLALERTLPLEARSGPWRGSAADPGTVAESLAVVDDLARRWRGRAGLLDVHVAPSAPQRCSDALLEGAAALARRLGTRLHTHALETRPQAEQARRRWGVPVVTHLERIGALGPSTVLAHVVWPTAEEIAAIARAGAIVVHNPASNLILGSGRAPLPALLGAGVTVALGTDAATCNDGLSLFEAMKLAAILHRPDEPDWTRWPTPAAVLRAASAGGAAALGLEPAAGRIAPGAPADLAILDRDALAFVPPNDLAHQLVMRAGPEVVRSVYVAGRPVVDAARVLTFDLPLVGSELGRRAAARPAAPAPSPSLVAAIGAMLRRRRADG